MFTGETLVRKNEERVESLKARDSEGYYITKEQISRLKVLISEIYVTNAGYNEAQRGGLERLIAEIERGK